MDYKPYEYQAYAEDHLIHKPEAALFLDMGLGKTVIALSAINRLMFDYLECRKVLIIAPKKVAESTWTDERDKWDHLKHLRIAQVIGDEKKRVAALRSNADIWIVSRDNVAWLVGFYGSAWPFDYVLIDELSSFKSSKAMRFKALRKVRPLINRMTGLTGTPAPNSLMDLWSQIFLLDSGKRLGVTKSEYKAEYFTIESEFSTWPRYVVRNKEAKQTIYRKISDICIGMRAKDYLKLPERINRRIKIKLPDKVLKKYIDFEREQIMMLDTGEDVTALNAAALSNKLLQFANGAVYDAEGKTHGVHDEKLEQLGEIIDVSNGQPVMVFYWYKHDLARIKQYLKEYEPKELKTAEDIKRWNKGEISVLLVHPASAGHGLNLQAGGNIIVWFGLTWSLELYQQANARLDRQGQQFAVIVHHLIAAGTIDEDVMKAIDRKDEGQEALMTAVKVRRLKYLKDAA